MRNCRRIIFGQLSILISFFQSVQSFAHHRLHQAHSNSYSNYAETLGCVGACQLINSHHLIIRLKHTVLLSFFPILRVNPA